MLKRLWVLLFPPKCVHCGKLLADEETDLCGDCRKNAPVFEKSNFRISFVAHWTAVWYYNDNVRNGILRFKFARRRSYAVAYGRHLAMKLMTAGKTDFEVLTWVTTGRQRKRKRGYDQAELLARSVAKEFGVEAVRTLKKIRKTPPQSTLSSAAQRRANVLGAYKVIDPALIAGKRVLVIDDVITTGATASECAKTLLTAGAKEILFAAVAVASHDTKK